MEILPKQCWGVITGDVIGFSDLDISIRRRMPRHIVEAGDALCKAFGPVMPWGVDVYRGDEWQALIADPVLVLRAALFFRAYIIMAVKDTHVDMRMAIGIGPIDYVPAGKVAAGDGPAYRASGKLLGTMTQPRHGKIRCAFGHMPESEGRIASGMPDEDLIDAVVRLTATIGNRWRNRQARAVIGALKGWSQETIAQNWPVPVRRQAVGSHLQRAGWDATLHALSIFEKKMTCFSLKPQGDDGQ